MESSRVGSTQPFRLVDQSVCNGCNQCGHRCTAGISLTRAEYMSIRAYLAELPAPLRDEVLGQSKEQPWPGAEDETTYTACRFFDTRSRLCLVYPVRPLICRLFGYVEWLPCPIGAVKSVWEGGPAEMLRRADEEQYTWEVWEQMNLHADI